MDKQKYPNAKAMILALALQVVGIDYEGRPVGLTYAEMLRRVRKAFPVNVYHNAHHGSRTKLNVKRMREYIYTARAERVENFLRLPVRPRRPLGYVPKSLRPGYLTPSEKEKKRQAKLKRQAKIKREGSNEQAHQN